MMSLKIPAEILIDRAEARSESASLYLTNIFMPFHSPLSAAVFPPLRQRVEHLARSVSLSARAWGADQWQQHRLTAKDRPGAERPDDFIVPHVNHPNVPAGLPQSRARAG